MSNNDSSIAFSRALFSWYNFKTSARVLLVSIDEKRDREVFEGVVHNIESVHHSMIESVFENNKTGLYDYIVCMRSIEENLNPVKILKQMKKLLKPDGKLLLTTNNRIGIKYFCGERDPYTHQNFDGIENYRSVEKGNSNYVKGRLYSKNEVVDYINEAGFKKHRVYSVFPSLEMPQLIFSDQYTPNEELAIRYFPKYEHPQSIFMDERYLMTDMIENGLFHSMANSLIVECCTLGELSCISQVTLSLDRGNKNSMATIVREKGIVEKRPIYSENLAQLNYIVENSQYLIDKGIKLVPGKIEDGSYVMPLYDEPIAMVYLRNLFHADINAFISEIDRFVSEIKKSSDRFYCTDEDDELLERGFVDLVPLNCFYVSGKFVFFDQEFYISNYPLGAIIYRSIEIIYMNNLDMESKLSKMYFYDKYNILDKLDVYKKLSDEFTNKLRNRDAFSDFNKRFEADYLVMEMNRRRINYSLDEFDHIFRDIFKNINHKELVLFGSGFYTKQFINQFEDTYPIRYIVDNNETKWGTKLKNIEIKSPKHMEQDQLDDFKVIVCVKNYLAIVRQLSDLGVKDFGVFNPNIDYPRDKRTEVSTSNKDGIEKKYGVGYIAGVFDMFHIGHLNLIRKAKQYCDYLIVGVVSDEGVVKYKKTNPVIPFEERLDIVSSIGFVDEAVRIPVEYNGSVEAYKMYKFDCQFSGSDYSNDPYWLANQKYLREHGSELIFLPYTKKTSSSKLKKIINKMIDE